MSDHRYQRLEEIFHQAADLSDQERARFLAAACAGDDSLQREVESLLEHDKTSNDTLIAAISEAVSDTQEPVAADEGGAAVIGRYHLLRRIGQGGMGEVWLAEQREPVRRNVALKRVKTGTNTHEAIARFEFERQALAQMDHPAIAKVFDADAGPDGVPFFVMEYVEGVPITVYCDDHRLDIRQRLELFIHVCEGVQHAHQKRTIHRDLKPSNILVTEVDGVAAPKIIDFGVAKELTPELMTDTLSPWAGALIGTLEYMSPEQALSSGRDIDTRTDIYSLGVIFYELLAGKPPLDLRGLTLDQCLRTLHDTEPLAPSVKLRNETPAILADLAHRRDTEPARLAKSMRGDLDSIASKALEKDRDRRYGSPSDLAADIGRYLRNEAVTAVQSSRVYHVGKFARRHRGAVVTSIAFALVLMAAAAVSIRQGIRANGEAAIAQAVKDFLQNDLLAQASPAQAGPRTKPDPNLKVRTALDRAAVRITGKFDAQPKVEADIQDTIGATYTELGLYPESREHLERALELERRALGESDPKTLKTMLHLGTTAFFQGRFADSEALLSRTLQIQRRVLGPENQETVGSMNNLANTYREQGKYAQAADLLRQTLDISRRVSGPESPATLRAMGNLANVYSSEGKYAEAADLYNQILEKMRRVFGPERPATLLAMTNLAHEFYVLGQLDRAETLFSQASEGYLRVLGPDYPERLNCIEGLAMVYDAQGNYPQAEKLFDQNLEANRRVLGREHLRTLISMDNLAVAYELQGKYASAEALFNQTLEISRRVLGPEHPMTLIFLADLAFMYQRQGKYALAETNTATVLAGRRHALGSEHPDTMASAAALALTYQSLGKFAESESLAREALDFYGRKLPDDWERFGAESLLGGSLAGQKRYAEAEPLLLAGYQGMIARKDRIQVPDYYFLEHARDRIVQLYQAWSKPEQAAEWQKR